MKNQSTSPAWARPKQAASWQSELGGLADPASHTGPLVLADEKPQMLIDALHAMARIRLTEEAVADMATAGEIVCPTHLAIGQEAMPVGVAAFLRKTDRAFGCHRSHGHYLAMGGDLRKLLAEMLGKYTGCSRGFGGSMHLFAQDVGFYGSVPIVAGTIPLATGAAIAAKFDGKGDIAVAFFGDGACEEGLFHECLNMAASMRLPIAFIVENNLFSSHLDIQLRQPSDRIARFAEASRIEHAVIDGNDITAVTREASRLIGLARKNIPVLLEGVTYRWRGHVGPREDTDVGLRRSPQEIAAWKMRDPIRRLLDAMIAKGIYSAKEYESFTAQTREELAALCAAVKKDPDPPADSLLGIVYGS